MSHELEALLKESREISWRNLGKSVRFYAPSFIRYENEHISSSTTAFPSISITGNSCALKCKHCGGRVLSTMIPATTPNELFEVCEKLRRSDCTGCLISGGCLPDGSVPFGRFLKSIKRVKRELGFKIIVHTGIIDVELAEGLKDVGVDAALIDIIGSEDTIREIYNLNIRVGDYDRSLKALQDSGIAFVPHVIVGLHYGKLRGEFNALKMISKYRPDALVVIALIPIKGTPLGSCDPPPPEDIAKVLATAKKMLPSVPIALGCMRPTGRLRARTDVLAVEGGVNAIAFPEKEAIELAESMGLKVEFSHKCCSQIYEDIICGKLNGTA